MSIATLKKKSRYLYSSNISGKQTSQPFIYQGPYGNGDNLASYIYKTSLEKGPKSGFSITGSHRNVGGVGQHMMFSKSSTQYKGIYPKGYGAKNGRYPDGPNNRTLNIMPVLTQVACQNESVKPPVLSTYGLFARKYRWMKGQYPNYWVQPVYTGNLTQNASQSTYIERKSVKNMCVDDVNKRAKYVGFCLPNQSCYKKDTGNYSKQLNEVQSSSEHTAQIQKCLLDNSQTIPGPVQTGIVRCVPI